MSVPYTLLNEWCAKKKEGGDAVNGLYSPIRYTSAAMTTIHQTDWNIENQAEGNSTDNFPPSRWGTHSNCLKNILPDFSQSLSSVNIAIFWVVTTCRLVEIYRRFIESCCFIIRLHRRTLFISHSDTLLSDYIQPNRTGFQIITLRTCVDKQAGLE
jgi:hypothetical protein